MKTEEKRNDRTDSVIQIEEDNNIPYFVGSTHGGSLPPGEYTKNGVYKGLTRLIGPDSRVYIIENSDVPQ